MSCISFVVSSVSGLFCKALRRLMSSANNEFPKKDKASSSLVACAIKGWGSTFVMNGNVDELPEGFCENIITGNQNQVNNNRQYIFFMIRSIEFKGCYKERHLQSFCSRHFHAMLHLLRYFNSIVQLTQRFSKIYV